MRPRFPLVAIAFVLVVFGSAEATANEEYEISTIRAYLGEMRDALDATPSGTVDKVDLAIDRAWKVRQAAERLRSLPAATPVGKHMAERYPTWVERFETAAKQLRMMKHAQQTQSAVGLPDKCDATSRQLRDEASVFVSKKDPAGQQRLPELAERAVTDHRASHKQLEDFDRNMSTWTSYARSFAESDEYGWDRVYRSMQDAPNAIVALWSRLRDDTQARCKDLLKGKDSALVQDALRQLTADDKTRNELLGALNTQLQAAAYSLTRVLSASSEADVDKAIAELDRMYRMLAELNTAAGLDATTRQIVDKWPRYLEDAKRACAELRNMKITQPRIDKAPEYCKAKRQERGDKLSKSHRGAGREAIAFAQQLGEDIQKNLTAADKLLVEVNLWRANVHAFDATDGGWDAIRRNLRAAATGIEEYFTKAHRAAHEQCDATAKGDKDETFLKKLQGKCTKNEQIELDKRVDEFCKQKGAYSCKKVPKGDCDELRRRMGIAESCAASREDLNNWCHDNNDAAHRDKAQEARGVQARCEDRVREECR